MTFPVVLPSYTGSSARWLVLHGWAQSSAFWVPLARRLPGVSLVCPDLRALAESCAAPAGSRERTAELVSLLAGADVSVIIAHSAGATVGVPLAHELPVSTLVLVDPLAHQLGLAAAPQLRGGAPEERSLRSLYPFASDDVLRVIEASGGAPSRRLGALTADPARADAVRSALATLPVELLLVRGERSALLSPDQASKIVATAPRGSAHTVERAGHSVHVDQPRALAALLTEHVRKTR